MAERLHSIRLFDNALVSGIASGIVSSSLDLRRDIIRLEGFMFLTSSPTSRADLSFEYAVSPNGLTFGSFADNTAVLTSTVSLAGISAGYVAVAMPNVLGPFVMFRVSGVASNPVDTRITGDMMVRLS